jgi:YVTN family beta-propeller protein
VELFYKRYFQVALTIAVPALVILLGLWVILAPSPTCYGCVVAGIPLANTPAEIAYDPWNGFFYVTYEYSDDVSVVSPGSYSIVDNISLTGDGGVIAYDGADGYMYVATTSGNVSIISGDTNTVVDTIHVGGDPSGITYDSSSNSIYVANGGSQVVVISASTNVVTGSIGIEYGDTVGLTYDSGNGDLYVGTAGGYPDFFGNVTVVSASTSRVIANLTVGRNPTGLAYDSGNGDVYAANMGSESFVPGNITVISGATNTAIAKFPVGNYPEGVAYDGNNGDVYVANYNSNSVSVIAGNTNAVSYTVPLYRGPWWLATDSANGHVFVTDAVSNSASELAPTEAPTIYAFVWLFIGVLAIAALSRVLTIDLLARANDRKSERGPNYERALGSGKRVTATPVSHVSRWKPPKARYLLLAAVIMALVIASLVLADSPLSPNAAICGGPTYTSPGNLQPLDPQCETLGLMGVASAVVVVAATTATWSQRWRWPTLTTAIGLGMVGEGSWLILTIRDVSLDVYGEDTLLFILVMVIGTIATFIGIIGLFLRYDQVEKRSDW